MTEARYKKITFINDLTDVKYKTGQTNSSFRKCNNVSLEEAVTEDGMRRDSTILFFDLNRFSYVHLRIIYQAMNLLYDKNLLFYKLYLRKVYIF